MKRNKTGKWLLWGFLAVMGLLTCITAWSFRPLPERVRTYSEGLYQITKTTSRTINLLPPNQWGLGSMMRGGARNGAAWTTTIHKLGFIEADDIIAVTFKPR
jgi:hypothetical protein